VRWRRLFGLVPSRPGRPFAVRDLAGAVAAYAIVLAFAAVLGTRSGFDDATSTATGLLILFVLILVARFLVERRIARQSGARRR
jgi:hypothetical protein